MFLDLKLKIKHNLKDDGLHAPTHTKEQLRYLFDIFNEQPWLMLYERQILSLRSICCDEDEQAIVKTLLQRFNYYDGPKIRTGLNLIALQITHNWALKEDDSVVLATAYDDDPDSSQLILQQIKSILVEHGWNAPSMINKFGRVIKKLKDNTNLKNIIILDEFSGTGDTIETRTDYLNKELKSQIPGRNFDIYVALICGMEKAEAKIDKLGVKYFLSRTLKAGITGYENEKCNDDLINYVKNIESRFLQKVNNHSIPSLGYGEAEALYYAENSNIPNSVFPIFWWKYLADGTQFDRIFTRSDSKYA